MTPAAEITGGILIGALLGVFNVFILRASVRRGLAWQSGSRAMLVILGSYLIRYLVIFLVVYFLLRAKCLYMALAVLSVLAGLTVLLAIARQTIGATRRKKCE